MNIQQLKQIAINKIKKQQQTKVTRKTKRTPKHNTKTPAKPKTQTAAYEIPAKNITYSHQIVYNRPAEAKQVPDFIRKLAEATNNKIKTQRRLKPAIKPWTSNH